MEISSSREKGAPETQWDPKSKRYSPCVGPQRRVPNPVIFFYGVQFRFVGFLWWSLSFCGDIAYKSAQNWKLQMDYRFFSYPP